MKKIFVLPMLLVLFAMSAFATIDVNITRPSGTFSYISTYNALDGSSVWIDFNIQAITGTDANYLTIRAYYSATPQAFTTSFYDANLTNIAVNPTADANCGASSYDFNFIAPNQRKCHIEIALSTIPDGNWYIDLNIFRTATITDVNKVSTPKFGVDTTAPTTSFTSPNTYGAEKETITANCSDGTGSGCLDLNYQIDGGTLYKYTTAFDLNTPGTHVVQFYSQDNVGNRETTQTASYYVGRSSLNFFGVNYNEYAFLMAFIILAISAVLPRRSRSFQTLKKR